MAWTNIAGYNIMKQTDRSSCGMACVCMVVNRKGMGRPTESMISNRSKKMDGGYGQALKDRFKHTGMQRMIMPETYKEPVLTKGYEGTYMNNLSSLLSEWQIKNEYGFRSGVMASMRSVKSGSPAIAQVDWGNGGSHFVLIEKFIGGPKGLIVCDPYYGIVAVDGTKGPNYSPRPDVVGSFNGWLITT